LLENLPKLL
jgi:hypothetical protein